MYATPAVGRPSECETLLRVSKRQEMRSLSPGMVIPLRTSARNAKDPRVSVPEESSLHEGWGLPPRTRKETGRLTQLLWLA
jgi:hypothetical protein